jgi:hypothetical protein
MPRVSAFYGIVIFFLYNEDGHEGRPHFHAEFAGRWVSYDIETVKPLGGHLPRRPHRLVTRWARLHQAELLANWHRAREKKAMVPIDPLP